MALAELLANDIYLLQNQGIRAPVPLPSQPSVYSHLAPPWLARSGRGLGFISCVGHVKLDLGKSLEEDAAQRLFFHSTGFPIVGNSTLVIVVRPAFARRDVDDAFVCLLSTSMRPFTVHSNLLVQYW